MNPLARILLELSSGVTWPIWPWHWAAVVRGMRQSEGWVPPMMIIAPAGMLMGVNIGIGLLGKNAAVQALGYISVATYYLVGSLATLAVLGASLRNLSRYAAPAPTRPRWNFEIGRSAWIVTLFAILGIPLLHFAAIPGKATLTDALVWIALAGLIVFFFFVSLGFLMSWVKGLPRRGKAYECVEYFYVIIGAGGAVTVLAINLPEDGPVVVVACVAAPALIGAFLLKLCNRWAA